MSHKNVVLIDFDGVMVDTFDICFGIQKQFSPDLTERAYRDFFTGNIYDAIEKIEATETRPSSDDDFFKMYIPLLMKQPLVKGIREALEELFGKFILVVVSSTISSPIKEYLESHKVAHFFDEIYGADVNRSKVEKIKMIFRKYRTSSDHCIFVTDTLGDLREAGKCSVKSIAVTWGFHTKEMLSEGHPAAYAENAKDIAQIINSFFDKA